MIVMAFAIASLRRGGKILFRIGSKFLQATVTAKEVILTLVLPMMIAIAADFHTADRIQKRF